MNNKVQHPSVSRLFAAAINGKFKAIHALAFPILESESVEVIEGKRFDKLVLVREGRTRSVHAFVERSTGNLIKAGGYDKPQPSKSHPTGFAVRFNISTVEGMTEAILAADVYGGYLYQR